MKRIAPKEATTQKAVVQLLRVAADPNVIWYHVPNGEHRDKVTGARLKAMGVRAGVADFAFILVGGQGAFLELKRGNAQLSRYQRAFKTACDRVGALYAVARDIDEVHLILTQWKVLRSKSDLAVATADREARGTCVSDPATVARASLNSNTRAPDVSA